MKMKLKRLSAFSPFRNEGAGAGLFYLSASANIPFLGIKMNVL